MFRRPDNLRAAATEFVLIVVGILAALAIDEWRDERGERELEREYLAAIRAALQADVDELVDVIYPEIEVRLEAARRLQSIDSANLPATYEEQRTVVSDINVAGFLRSFQPSRAAIDDLISTGNAKLIRNRQLRLDILEYFQQLDRWAPYDEWSRHVVWYRYRNEVTHFVPLELLALRDGHTEPVPRNVMLELLEHPTFNYGVMNVIATANWQSMLYPRIEERIHELIAAIDAELGDPG